MLRTLRTVWVVALVSFATYFLVARHRSIDGAVQDRYSHDVRLVAAADARLGAAILESRSGMTAHYDDLVRQIRVLHQLHARLATPPAFLTASGARTVASILSASRRLLAQKERLVERFKTEHAVLRNSLRFVPIVSAEIASRAGRLPSGRALAGQVNDLLGDVLLFNLVADRDLVPQIETRLAAIEAVAAAGEDDPASLRLLAAHARVILDRKPRVDDLVARALALPTARHAAALDRAYSASYAAALRRAATDRLLLFLLALAVVGIGATEIILRLQSTARALGTAKEELQSALVALRAEQEKEKELGELKARFVSMTSHEFRRPLAIILSSTELLEAYGASWPDEKRKEHFGRVQESVRAMVEMVDAVLTIGQADAGMLEFAPAPVDVPAFCRGLVDATPGASGDHRVALACHGDWKPVSMDDKLLRHILGNLLSNAVKYSPEGGTVHFDVFAEGGLAIFEVRDEGIGIPPEDLPRLFDIFHRGRNVGSISGTGLGLAIVKKAVDAHGGSIRVLSGVGKGTRFIVKIPMEAA